jgi:hypothetical protein
MGRDCTISEWGKSKCVNRASGEKAKHLLSTTTPADADFETFK